MYQKGLLPDRVQCRKKQVKSVLSIHSTDSTDSTEYSAVHAVMDRNSLIIALHTHFRLLACRCSSILLRQCKQSMEYGGSGCRMQDEHMYYVCRVQCMVQAQ